MQEAGVPCVPGSGGPLGDDLNTNTRLANDIGYPIIIKAAGGGGGRGMRVVHTEATLMNSIALTKQEAAANFGNDMVYMEKYLETPRHVEIQIVGDQFGIVYSYGERDCSVQRRHQKLLEEAPSPALNADERTSIGTRCTDAMKKLGYRSAGTIEFLYENG